MHLDHVGRLRKWYFLAVTLVPVLAVFSSAPLLAQSDDPPTMKFVSTEHKNLIKELIQAHGFDEKYLTPLFNEAVILPEILPKAERSPEKQFHYYEYRDLFLKEGFLDRGYAYFEQNAALLQKAEEKYGVPKQIIAAILGVETRFGTPGIEKYRAWDILNTSYALNARRRDFYKGELIAFLKLCREEGLDPLSIKSSYAGAMGVPQFMPSSVLEYAVDADLDGKRNLWSSNEDIYFSVANYLMRNGWKKDGPIYTSVKVSDNPTDMKAVETGVYKTFPVSDAVKTGIEMPEWVGQTETVSFVYYKPASGKDLFLALFDNFRAITRYNISVNYALVVTEVSEMLSKGKPAPPLPTSPPIEEAVPEINKEPIPQNPAAAPPS
jgi:membrane-bound lytic murein transglycosylase B